MFAMVGFVLVLMSVIGGFLMEKGNVSMLIQPAELVIIVGAALGSFVIASPRKVIFGTIRNVMSVLKAKESSKSTYTDVLLLLFELLTIARREGLVGIESHVNHPEDSKVFTTHPNVAKNRPVLDFICDNFKVFMSGNMEPHEFDNMMDVDIEAQHTQALVPSSAIGKVADSLPGLGIVAAVLGVVLTMGKMNEPPEVLGHSIGAALVGTFLGVLLCYGFVGPVSINLEHMAREKQAILNVIKTSLTAFAMGMPPVVAVEVGRRAILSEDRPSFDELEGAVRVGRKQDSSQKDKE